MELKPGYKQTEVGPIPADWNVTPLNQCLSRPPRYGINAAAVPFDDTLPTYIRITDISEDGRFVPAPKVSVAHREATEYLLSDGDLVFARTGASVGKSYCYDPSDGVLVFAGFLIQITPDINRLRPRLLKQYVQTAAYWNWVATMSTRSGQPGINGQEYGTLLLPLPPTTDEQDAIAMALSDVDALLEGLDRLIAKKRDLKQAAMQQLLTGETRLEGFDDEWRLVQFSELTSPSHNRIEPSRSEPCNFCVELEHIEQGTGRLIGWSSTTPQSSLKAVFEPGDVLFGKLRAYLRKYWVADRPGVCSTEIWVLKPNTENVASGYLYQLVTTNWFIDAASTAYGTHMPRSDWKVIRELELQVPSPPEQEAIAQVLGDMDAEIEVLVARRDKTRAIKQGMMQQLLTGQVRLVNRREARHGY
jgi:type I restriction enzyme S subunit